MRAGKVLLVVIAVSLIAVVGLVGCAVDPSRSDAARPLPSNATASVVEGEPTDSAIGDVSVSVAKSGFYVFEDRFSAAALIVNDSKRFAGDVRLRLTFYNRQEDVLGTVRDSLPYCPADSRCWWARSYSIPGEITRQWRSISRLHVEIVRAPAREAAGKSILAFRVHRGGDGTVRGRAPGNEGLVYIIGLSDGKPRSGIFVNIAEEDGLPRRISVPEGFLPAIAGERLRAVMYDVEFEFGH